MIMHFKSLSCLLIAQNQLTNQTGSKIRVKKHTTKNYQWRAFIIIKSMIESQSIS